MASSRSTHPLLRLLLALLVSVLAGVLVAGLAVPWVGGAGLAAKAAADEFVALPAELETARLATRSQVLAADGSVLATFYRVNRIEAPWEQIPEVMREAQVAIEDARFYEHKGVDYRGTLRAAATNARSGRVAQGGSTITQQYVKNALLEAAGDDKEAQQAARDDTLQRKLREARYALALEERLSKDEILHRYLQVAYYGHGVYGVGTAAQYFFRVPVQDLTLGQSAVLAGVVQNPARFNLASRDRKVRAEVVARRNTVLGRMRDLGHISERQRARAAASPLPRIRPKKMESGCEDKAVKAAFFCDHVRHELESTDVGAALGATRQARQARLFGGGLTIRTTLDPKVQAVAQRAVERNVPNGDPSRTAAVADVVEPGTGAIRAMAVSRPFGDRAKKGETKVNLATGGTTGFQPGSTFKIFWLAEAIRDGMDLDDEIFSPAKYFPRRFDYKDVDGKPRAVNNAEVDEEGDFDLRSGTHASVNTFYMQVAERIGLEKPLELAESMGLRQFSRGGAAERLPRIPSAVLGSLEVSPLAMAGAYAAFAASGRYCPPQAVTEITDASGREVRVPKPDCGQALDAEVADTVSAVLTGVVDGKEPLRTGRRASIGRPVAGKTGTTTGSSAAWFVGYTPQLATAVWVGKLPNPKPMRRIRINGNYYRQVFGGTVPAMVFADVMRPAHRGLPEKKFPKVEAFEDLDRPERPEETDEPERQDQRTSLDDEGGQIPGVTGRSFDAAVSALREAGFSPTAGRTVTSRLPAGTVPYTFPRGGTSAPPGTTVYVYRSAGG